MESPNNRALHKFKIWFPIMDWYCCTF